MWRELSKMPRGGGASRALYQAFSSYGLDPSERDVRRLFWRDDMENYNTVKWDPLGNATVAYVNNAPPAGAFEGDYVLRIQNAVSPHIEAHVRFGCFKAQKIGFEMRWFKDAISYNSGFVELIRCERDINIAIRGVLFWTTTRGDGTPGWRYYDSMGNIIDIPGATEYILDDTWNYVKVIIDWEKGTFHRLVTNLLDLDLSSLSLLSLSDVGYWHGGAGHFRVVVIFDCLGAGPWVQYIDDARLYLNEV